MGSSMNFLRSTFILLTLYTSVLYPDDAYRAFTDSRGWILEARIESITGTSVRLEDRQGKIFEVPLENLSPPDQAFIRLSPKNDSPRRPAFTESTETPDQIRLNHLAGRPVFLASDLWTVSADQVAAVLSCKRESQTAFSSSFRLYPGQNYILFGANPKSVSVYGDGEGNLTSISLIYANKGDFLADGTKELPKDAAALSTAVHDDYTAIRRRLGIMFEESVRVRFGEGSSRTAYERWDWNGHAFLLQIEPGEFVSLLVVPSSSVDRQGGLPGINLRELQDTLKNNVVVKENQDILITNIPMVDQGAKGYCLPATAERVLRYMNIQADMYRIAMEANTDNDGTYTDNLIDVIRSDVRRRGLKIHPFSGPLEPGKLMTFLQRGIPVFWHLSSTNAFHAFSLEHTHQRNTIQSRDAWAEYVQQISSELHFQKNDTRTHMNLIIGYNPVTDEICYTDSWGISYKERWAPRVLAEQVSYGEFFVIDF